MEFNKIERIAITSILIGMMNVDNDVDLREVLYFNQIQNTIGITQEEFEQWERTEHLTFSSSYKNHV